MPAESAPVRCWRHEAQRFYARLGFVASHEGMKRPLWITAAAARRPGPSSATIHSMARSDLETARRSMLAMGVSADAIARGRAVLEQAGQAGTLESVARAQSLQSGDEMTFVPLLVVLASTATAGDVPRSGYFGAGVNLEPLALGPMQAFSGGRAAVGISLQASLQVDLGARWAFRLPLEVGVGGSGDATFSELGLTPGLLYRWRDDAAQRWVPYLGGGLKLGAAGAGRELLGLPLVTTVQSLDLDFDDDDSESDPNFESRLGAFPEVWAGVEWHPNRWFALNLGVAYTYVRVLGTSVHLLHERVGVRFSL